MLRRYEQWESRALGRTMELLWFGEAGLPVVLFPTSMGRFYQYEDMGLIAALEHEIIAGRVQAVCVDSVDAESFYREEASPAERLRRHDEYDRYLRNELVPHVQARTSSERLATFGCSFGAYHAANFAGRYPELVTRAVCLSGVYTVHRFVGGHWDDLCYFHSPAAYISNMDEEWVRRLRTVEWVIATGELDSLINDNRRFDELLTEKRIPHHTEFWPGVFGHDWPYWNGCVARLLCAPLEMAPAG